MPIPSTRRHTKKDRKVNLEKKNLTHIPAHKIIKKRPLQKKYANKSCDISVFGQVFDKILKLAQVICTCYMAYITLDQFVTS